VADLTDQVRDSCRAVVAGAELVRVDPDALAGLAEDLVRGPTLAAPAPRPVPLDGPGAEAAIGLVLALDAVNFGSGWHDAVRKRPGLSGARTMAAGLRDHVAHTGPLTPGRLRALDAADCSATFGQDLDHPEAGELMALFARSLNDLGALVADRFDGRFTTMVEAADGSAVALAASLLELSTYRDRAALDGVEVHFYKRAQITPADLHRELAGAPPGRFGDLDRLTAFADNLVPHVLRVDGVLRYDPALAAHIDAGQRLEAGSRAEIEIRAAGVHAVELLVAALAARGRPQRAMDVDLVLWSRGAAPRYKAVRRHRARTVFY
jgi:hypothetical protein